VWFQTAAPDPLDVVASVVPGYYYMCPDLASVDAHLAELGKAVRPGSNLTVERRAQLRLDIDRLLDRRVYLEMCAPRRHRVA
jgi:hypothetical protein